MALTSIFISRNLARVCANLISKATICHKSELPEKKVYHWPYEKYPYNIFTMWYDPFTRKKFDENSKIIQIEGNVGSGKEEFGRILADELGMKFMPMPKLEEIFFNSYGFDYRSLNPQLPERLRICDWKMFHENPTRHSAIHLLHYMYLLRLEQYMNAICHLFNTGQGIVFERSVFTENVLIEAMHEVGWLPMGHTRVDGLRFFDWRERYRYIRANTLTYMLQPSLTIYLDVPPQVCKERLDKHPDPMIANSKANTLPFLQAVQNHYENDILNRVQYYGHLIRCDNYHDNCMSPKETVDDTIEYIRKIDFDTREVVGDKFATWVPDKFLWHFLMRKKHTGKQVMDVYTLADQPYYDIAGLGDSITEGDLRLKLALYENHVVGYDNHIEDDPKQSGFLSHHFSFKPLRTTIRRSLFAEFS